MSLNLIAKENLKTKLSNLKLDFIHFETIDSTNEEAKRRAYQEKNFEGVIVSDTQTHGKGRKGHKWYSATENGLYYTLALKPEKFDFQNLYFVTQSIAKIAINVIENISLEKIDLEWPNDLILANKKVGGILLETILTPFETLPKNLIIGIGLNLNQTNFPEDLRHVAISLFQKTGQKYNKEIFIDQLTSQLIKFFKF